ncbi:OmpA family protein [Nonomuraea typhae]|uniref:OmpA family protein n=1 Tax=Nonomuraea typhae TaxID=2603600 RepID=A0ABW7YM26_9ACTN
MRTHACAGLSVLAILASGCSVLDGAQATTARADAACTALKGLESDGTTTAEQLVIMVDRSASMRNKESGEVPDWYAAIFAADGTPLPDGSVGFGSGSLIPSLRTPATISIGAFDGGNRVTAAEISLPRMSGGEVNRRDFAANTGACLRFHLEEKTLSAPETEGSNVLAAFQPALTGAGQGTRRTLVVASDGLSTTGCAGLLTTAMRDPGHADRIVKACTAQKAVPALRGWSVRMPWVGGSGKGHSQPQQGHLTWLERLWSGLCTAATGEAGSCEIGVRRQPGTLPAENGRRTTVKEGAGDVAVTFHQGEHPPSSVRTKEFPGDLLFATDSATLSAGGTRRLKEFAVDLAAQDPETVTVIGHTDRRGSSGHNAELSGRRAESVAALLQEEGLAGVAAEGAGEGRPKPGCRGDSAADYTCNRRVEIVYKVRG